MAGEKKFTCIGECKKEFKFGDWECFPGVSHEVEEKTYYLNDAPYFDPTRDPQGLSLRASRNNMAILPPKMINDGTGVLVKQDRPPVKFIMGRLATRDPEIQFFLERSGTTVSYEKWYEAYHTPVQKQRIKDNSLLEREAKLNDAKSEENTLLANIKRLKEEQAKLENKVGAR